MVSTSLVSITKLYTCPFSNWEAMENSVQKAVSVWVREERRVCLEASFSPDESSIDKIRRPFRFTRFSMSNLI